MHQFSMYTFLVTYFLSVLTYKQYGIKRNQSQRKALFRKITTNRKLDITPIDSHSNCDRKCCAKYCIRTSNCKSFNYNSALKICNLLSVDRNTKTDAQLFVDDNNWSYYDTGFDLSHPSWKNKNVYNYLCPINLCEYCQCVLPTEESGYQCHCFAGEGQIIKGTFCWTRVAGCDQTVTDSPVVITDNCSPEQYEQQFKFNSETGDLIHVCTNKRVCSTNGVLTVNTPIIVSDNCPVPVNKVKWMITEAKFLYYGTRCVHVASDTDGAAVKLHSTCMFSDDSRKYKFRVSVNGRVKVELWTNILREGTPYMTRLTSLARYPDSPTRIDWFHSMEAASYYTDREHFGRVMTTRFVSPETGAHKFFVSADGTGQLFIGLTEQSTTNIINKHGTGGWYTGTAVSALQQLQSGTIYFLKGRHYEGTMVDYFVVGVQFPSGKIAFPITGKYLLTPS